MRTLSVVSQQQRFAGTSNPAKKQQRTRAQPGGRLQHGNQQRSPPSQAQTRVQRLTMAFAAVPAAEADIAWELSPEAETVVRGADAFCFDVDSTFCSDESIDELAAFLGVGEKVSALTAQAMGGSMLFQDSLRVRLDAMRPSIADVERFLASHPPQLSPGIQELVACLQASGKGVYLVSGGFRQIIHPIAESLGIPLSSVFGNTLLFKEDGSYAGFDANEFTSRSGGKREAVEHIKQRDNLRSVVAVGDGATDAEARAPGAADLFVCYAGVVLRPGVAANADWTVRDMAQLTAAVQQGAAS